MFGPPPPEVNPPVVIEGTAGADLINAIGPVVVGLPGDLAGNELEIYTFGGDDTIIRDRVGSYEGINGQFRDVLIDAGTGFDILVYNTSDDPITARLDKVWNRVYGQGGEYVWIESNTGYSLITGLGLPFAGEMGWLRGLDAVKGVNGIAGSVFGDALHGSDTANKFWGHDGDDSLYGNGGNDSLWGGLGDDLAFGGTGNDLMSGEDGADSLYGGDGNDTIYGGDGDDKLFGGSGNDTIHGGNGHDSIRGGRDNDVITTGDGADTVRGDEGNDTITVQGFGNKTINGGSGTDTLVFEQKVVVSLSGGFAQRGQNGVEGTDAIAGIENVTSAHHDDIIVGSNGANVIRSMDGHDQIAALDGNDTVYAGTGNDIVQGGDGDDWILGEDGNDVLYGGAGNDTIWGGHGVDTIRGGAGADELWGNQPLGLASQIAVKDVFVWAEGDIGYDQVFNFSIAYDRLRFEHGFLAEGATKDQLLVVHSGSGAMLAANIAGHGWDFIARFDGVSAAALAAAIDSGSVFDIELTGVGGGGPGGFGSSGDPDTFGFLPG